MILVSRKYKNLIDLSIDFHADRIGKIHKLIIEKV